MASTWGEIVTDALVELNVYAPNEAIPAEDQQYVIRALNRLLDWMAARKAFAFATEFAVYTLTSGHAPTLLGPNLASPDFATPNAAPRPLRLESASLILNDSTPSTDLPMNLRDRAWWASERVKTLESNVPTDLFYNPVWDPESVSGSTYYAGELNFWPNPDYAYQVRLEMWLAMGQFPVDDAGNPNLKALFAAPPAYERGIVKMLAGEIATAYEKPISPGLAAAIRECRAAIEGPNLTSPRIQSADWGTRGQAGPGRADWNWQSGLPG